jgi:hypothetical protein
MSIQKDVTEEFRAGYACGRLDTSVLHNIVLLAACADKLEELAAITYREVLGYDSAPYTGMASECISAAQFKKIHVRITNAQATVSRILEVLE